MLQAATEERYMAKEHYGFVKHQAVRIIGTAFDGFIASVDSVVGQNVRVILPMTIGRAMSVVIKTSNLEPLPVRSSVPPTMIQIPCEVH